MKHEGFVKFFDSKKGWGYLLRDGQKDLFVHYTAIQAEGFRTLFEGDKVQYEVGTNDKGGEQAASVVILEKANDRRRKAKEAADVSKQTQD